MLSIKHTSLFIILSSDLFLFIPSLLEYISHNTYIYRSRHQTLRASMTIRTNSLDMNCHGLFIAVGQNIGLNHRFLEEHGFETVCWTGLGLRALTDPQLRQFPAWLEAETSADPADPAASSELKAYIINCFFLSCVFTARSKCHRSWNQQINRSLMCSLECFGLWPRDFPHQWHRSDCTFGLF